MGVTRAKNSLAIFYFSGESTFGKEFFGAPAAAFAGEKRAAGQRTGIRKLKDTVTGQSLLKQKKVSRKVTEDEYYDKLEELQTTGYVKHQVYGESMIVSMRGDTIEVQFREKVVKCKLKFMMEHELIE